MYNIYYKQAYNVLATKILISIATWCVVSWMFTA